MALEYVVGGLLLGSAFVNVLALGSFWVTPSLRTTANRFVINLLVANLISCIILGPSLLLNSVKITVTTSVTPIVYQPADLVYNHTTTVYTTAEEWNSTPTAVVSDEIRLDNPIREEIIEERFSLTEIRCWGLDVAAALGALSVLLVVGDTWCAVTDPLRYHTRLSDLKAIGFIAGIWFIGIVFGIASAFRSDQSQRQHFVDDQVYNTVFSYTYFVVAILLPFTIVCGMYWQIFSEARESGLRMRQNGSSPLLQSALNLAAVSAATTQTTTGPNHHQHHHHNQHVSLQLPTPANERKDNPGELITMRIDKQLNHYNNNILNGGKEHQPHCNTFRKSSLKDSAKPFVAKPELSSTLICSNNNNLSDNVSDSDVDKPKISLNLNQISSDASDGSPKFLTTNDRNQNILLTLTTSSSNEHIRRNFSARQLFLVSPDDDDDNFHVAHPTRCGGELRHASSAPNLPKHTTFDVCHTFHHRHRDHHHNHRILPMPTVQVPPRALGYMTSIRHRLSNASSLFKYREESRAARISILVVIMFLVSYLPYGILVIMQGHTDLLQASNQALLAIFTVVLANLSSPFIFAYRNKRVRRGVLRLLGVEKRTTATGRNSGQVCAGAHCRRSPKSMTTVQRSQSSVSSCKYLSPHAAALAAAANGNYILEIERFPQVHRHCGGVRSPEHSGSDEKGDDEVTAREKKSILKRVCDTSRKWGCTCANNSCIQAAETTDV